MEKQIGNMVIKHPDIGFAFNPIRVIVNNYTGTTSVSITANGVTIEKEPINNIASFDLSAIAKALFNRDEFYIIEELDTKLKKTLSFSISGSNGLSYTASIPVIWGALQIGEIYNQNKNLTFFKGFPFTVPIFSTESISLQYKIDGGVHQDFKYLSAGKHNVNIDDIPAKSKIEFFNYWQEERKIFSYVFDSRFGPQIIDIRDPLGITINVVDCPNDGIYLRWINKHGEYNYYLFHSSVKTTSSKNNDVSFDNLLYSIDLVNNYHSGTGKSIGKEIEKTTKLFASLVDSNTFDLLLSLSESPVVDMFLGYNDSKEDQWVSISIQDGTFSKSTDNLQDFEIYIIPNKTQVQNL